MTAALKVLPPPAAPSTPVQDVILTEILRSPFNRDRGRERGTEKWKEFVDSIRQHGIIQPLLGRPLPTALDPERKPGTPRVELVIGEGRWLGAAEAGLATVPMQIRQLTDREVLELQTEENDKRTDLDPLQKGQQYQRLLEQYGKEGLSKEKAMEELCRRLGGKGKATVYEAIGLLKLPDEVKQLVSAGTLPPSHAAQVAKISDMPDVLARALRVIAPADPSADEVSQLEDEFDVELEAARSNTGVLPFRATKALIEGVEKLRELRNAWTKRSTEHHDAGGYFVAEPAVVMPYVHRYVDTSSGYVELSTYCSEYGDSYAKLVPKKSRPPSGLVHSTDYSVILEVYRKADLLEIIKASGRKANAGSSGGSSSNSAAAAKARAEAAATRQKTAERRALVTAVVEKARATPVTLNELLPFLLMAMRQRALSDSIREMFNRRKLDRKEYKPAKGSYAAPHSVWLERELAAAKSPGAQLALVVDLAAAFDLSGYYGSDKTDLLAVAARIFKVDPKKVTEPAAAAKVRASGKKQTPTQILAESRAKPKKTTLTTAGRKKLAAAMKKRWAARRTDAVKKGAKK